MNRRQTCWQDVEAAVDALRAAHHELGAHVLELPPQTLHQLLPDVHKDFVARIFPDVLRARPKKRFFTSYFMALVDRKAQKRRDEWGYERTAA